MTDLRVFRDGSEIYVWEWEANYRDGSVLKQNDGSIHKFREIDQSRLSSFVMRSIYPGVPPVVLMWKEGRKLINFTRVSHLNLGTPGEIIMRRYCFGYEDKNSKFIITIMPDGSVVASDDVSEFRSK